MQQILFDITSECINNILHPIYERNVLHEFPQISLFFNLNTGIYKYITERIVHLK